jgi:hypothetical protein
MTRVAILGCCLTALVLGCGGGGGSTSSSESTVTEEGSGGGEGVVVIDENDPRVSTSAGEEGGIVVLWPRVMGLPGDEAGRVQAHIVELVRRRYPNAPVDIRPDPERVCPRSGCRGASVGALLVVQDGSCATVGIVGRPGAADLTLLRWSGDLTVRDREVPFREPPESHVTLHEASPCGDLERDLQLNDAAVEEALRAAMAD